jgi:hypothetical protein
MSEDWKNERADMKNTKQDKYLRRSIYYEKEIEKMDRMASKYGYDNLKNSPYCDYFFDCYGLMMFYYKISLIKN